MRRPLILLLLLALAVPASARRRAGSFAPDTTRLLAVLAHPDDETLLAPLLGPLCTGGRAACTLLVLTNGEASNPRRGEMAAAAAFLGAGLTHRALPDVMAGFGEAWREADAIVRDVVEQERPTVILTFDPAHGSTCHPAHRETGAVVLRAGGSHPVVLLETAAVLGEDIDIFNAAPHAALEVDATATWSWLVSVAALHASQFSAAQLDSLRATPPPLRRVWLTPASRLAGASYVAECTANVAGAVP